MGQTIYPSPIIPVEITAQPIDVTVDNTPLPVDVINPTTDPVNVTVVSDMAYAVAAGLIPGSTGVNKFGENPDITAGTTEDVWDGGGTYVFPTTADITHIRQPTNQATMQGETIEVQGLDASWVLTVQTVVLDGTDTTTPVALGTALIRVFRMKVLADVVTTQDVELRNVGGGTTYALIQAGNNQTLMAIYTVPAGKTAYMTQYYADNVPTASKIPDSVEFKLWMADRDSGYEFQLKHKRAIPLQGDGFIQAFNPYLKITQKTDIRIDAEVVGGVGDDGHPHAGFDLILVDN